MAQHVLRPSHEKHSISETERISITTAEYVHGRNGRRWDWMRGRVCHKGCVVDQGEESTWGSLYPIPQTLMGTLMGIIYWLKEKASLGIIKLQRIWLFATLWTTAHQAPLSMRILQARILEWAAMPFSRSSQGLNPHLLLLLHWQMVLYH